MFTRYRLGNDWVFLGGLSLPTEHYYFLASHLGSPQSFYCRVLAVFQPVLHTGYRMDKCGYMSITKILKISVSE